MNGPKKLLIIDDSKPIHRLVQAWMKEEPIEIHSAYDGKSGLALAAQQNGFEVCKALKAAAVTAEIPVIFLSAVSATEEKITGLDVGAIDYITKPFNPGELKARIRAALRRAA
jgi:DNA-binding response OmpR family regulator